MSKIFKFQGEKQFVTWLFLSLLTAMPAVVFENVDLSLGMRACLVVGSFVGWYVAMVFANAMLGD